MGLQPKEWIKSQAQKLGAAVRGVAEKFQENKKIGNAEKTAAEFAKKIGGQAVNLCLYTSQAVIQNSKRLAGWSESAFGKTWCRISQFVGKVWNRVMEEAVAFGKRFSKPFVSVTHAPRLIAAGYRNHGIGGAASVFFQGIRNNRNVFRTVLNYGAPVLGIVVLCNVVGAASRVTYAVEVMQNGQLVGYITFL